MQPTGRSKGTRNPNAGGRKAPVAAASELNDGLGLVALFEGEIYTSQNGNE